MRKKSFMHTGIFLTVKVMLNKSKLGRDNSPVEGVNRLHVREMLDEHKRLSIAKDELKEELDRFTAEYLAAMKGIKKAERELLVEKQKVIDMAALLLTERLKNGSI